VLTHRTADHRQVVEHCFYDVLYWYTNSHCGGYIQPRSQQQPPEVPAWDGHTPDEGVIYNAACFALDGVDGAPYVHWPTPMFFPSGEGMVGSLIEQVIAMLPLSGAEIGIAPDPAGADRKSVV